MNIIPQDPDIHIGPQRDYLFVGLLLAFSISLMFANFLYVSVQDQNDKRYISVASELRVLSQSIEEYANNAADGNQDAFGLWREQRDAFENGLYELLEGDELELNPRQNQIRQYELTKLQETWRALRRKIDAILARQNALLELPHIYRGLTKAIPQLQVEYDKVIAILIKSHSPIDQITMAERQKLIAERMLRFLDRVLDDEDDAREAADAFSRQASLFRGYLNAMQEGSIALGVSKVTQEHARKILQEIAKSFSYVGENIQQVIRISEQLIIVRTAAHEIFLQSQLLLEQSTELLRAYSKASEKRIVGPLSGYFLGGISMLLLFFLFYRFYSDTKASLVQTALQYRANRTAVLRLLDELGTFVDGDLTVHATVSEDMTGAIAESVNYAVDVLRKLVFTINDTAVQVSASAQEVQSTARYLVGASESQAKEIIGATAAINAMAASVEHVSADATESATVAGNAVNIAKNGVMIVQGTMSGFERIKGQIQETAKQVKRLGESSQEIGDIVSLIDDISDQTNILGLNAAIQAAIAGEEGHGFAVVAEEVQRLAERSNQATKQIETLVRTIQNDTHETVKLMEQTTSEVVQGGRLAQDAGVALEKLERTSLHLAELIQNISNEAKQQTVTASKISKTMAIIQKITTETASGTLATATSIGLLAEFAMKLRDSVAGFKLPSQEHGK